MITWTCHLCGRERPDDKISVFTKDLSAAHGLPPGTMKQNVRYCNDCPKCIAQAPDHELFKQPADELFQRGRAAAADKGMQARYVAQIERMVAQGRVWIVAHPKANPKVQLNFTEKTMIIGVVSDALKEGMMSANDEGRALIAAMWAGLPDAAEPTPFMVRCVMELLDSTDL